MDMEKREELIVYRKRDIDKVVGFIDSLECKGIAAARKLALIASILEAGKTIKGIYRRRKKEGDV